MKTDCDVVIIGAGVAGSTLGLILAPQGLHVSLVDQACHPRFALGESLLRPTTLWMKVLAARYGIPELDVLADLGKISREIAPTSGVKQCFGFLHHTPGAASVDRSWWLSLPPSFGEETLEGHLFRQDTDAYLFYSAVSSGCRPYMGVSAKDIEFQDQDVCITLGSGDTVRAKYLVDASGAGSVIARKFGLRKQPPPFKTASRVLFTHMLGVASYDDLGLAPQPARKWNDGTLHHIFKGGWMWVIPFGNHRDSTNPLTSVGLSLDMDHFPRREAISPEQEWREILERFPAIAAQFREAVPIRNWVATDRLQYASESCVGDRYCLLSQAAGSVDALYSRGLLNTFQGLNLTASLILDAFKQGDFSAKHFSKLDRQQKNLLSLNDGIVRGTYSSFQDPELFEIWLGIYSLCERLSISHVLEPFHRYLSSGETSELAIDEEFPDQCLTAHPQFVSVLNRCLETMDELEAGSMSRLDAIEQMKSVLRHPGGIEFDYDTLISVVTRLNFTKAAKRLVEFERVLLEILDGIDETVYSDDSHRLRSSVFMSYFVRAVVKELVKSCQQKTSSTAQIFAEPISAIQDNMSPDSGLIGVSLDSQSLLAAIRGVRPEVAPTEQQKQDMLQVVGRIIQLQVCKFETTAWDDVAYEACLLDAGWQVLSKSRTNESDGRISIWRLEHTANEEVLIVYKTECRQTYLVHVHGVPDSQVYEQGLIPRCASQAST